jgi:hypothetical protein
VGFALCALTSAACAADIDKPGWVTHQNKMHEFEFQSPKDLSQTFSTGERCVNDVCKPLEDFALRGVDPVTGKMTTLVRFSIQRNLVKGNISIEKYCETEMKKALDPQPVSFVILAGRNAVRQKGTAISRSTKGMPDDAGRVVFAFDGSTSPVTKSEIPVDRILVLLNAEDLLVVTNQAAGTPFDATFDEILSTLRWAPK